MWSLLSKFNKTVLPVAISKIINMNITEQQGNGNRRNGNIIGNFLYAFAVIMLTTWVIGFLGYNAGYLIHILLVVAAVLIIIGVIKGRKITL